MLRSPFLSVLIAVPAAWAGGSPASSTQARALPAAVRMQLSAAYPGWRFARVGPVGQSDLAAESGRGRSAEWVSGDYNGDRRTDFAVQIVRQGPADSAQLVLAFLAVPGGYRRFLLTAGRVHLGLYIGTSRRGDRVFDLEKNADGDSTFVLLNDAVDLLSTEGGGSTCLYESGRWRCVLSSD